MDTSERHFQSDLAEIAAEKYKAGTLSRRGFLTAMGALGLVPLLGNRAIAQASEVVVCNWGGQASDILRDLLGKAFEEETGIPVRVDGAGPSAGKVRAMVESGAVVWDVCDSGAGSAIVMNGAGVIQNIDYSIVDKSKVLDGTAGLWCVNAGHCRPKITEAISQQAGELDYAPAFQMGHPKAFELANRLEDLLGGGANLEEAAAQLNLRIVKVAAVDKSALDPAGRKVESLPGGDFLSIAFVTEESADSLLTETGDDGYFVLRVDGVTARALRPLDTVKAKVAEAWKAGKRAEKAKQSAESVIARVKGGTGLDVIAKELGLTIKSPPATVRRPATPDPLLFQALINGVFAVQPGQAAMARNNDGYTVARLKTIIAANPVPDKKGVEQLAGQISDSMEVDVLTQLTGALRERYGVTVNRQIINQLFTGVGGGRRPIRNR